jgi:hypothetical protein
MSGGHFDDLIAMKKTIATESMVYALVLYGDPQKITMRFERRTKSCTNIISSVTLYSPDSKHETHFESNLDLTLIDILRKSLHIAWAVDDVIVTFLDDIKQLPGFIESYFNYNVCAMCNRLSDENIRKQETSIITIATVAGDSKSLLM